LDPPTAAQPGSGTRDDDDNPNDERDDENDPPIREVDDRTEAPEEFLVDEVLDRDDEPGAAERVDEIGGEEEWSHLDDDDTEEGRKEQPRE
jgi:hypothetical protein